VSDVELIVCDDAEVASRVVAEHLVTSARRGGHIALSGGSTPRPAYELAAELESDWGLVDLWLGDERLVPPADERSNFRLVREALVSRVRVPPRLHPVDTSLAGADAAAAYAHELEPVVLDLAFQGLGGDGHTASLFPDADALQVTDARAVSTPAGLEPWVERVTMTISFLAQARCVLYLVLGAEKADAARRAFVEEPETATPASLVRSAAGRTIAILDPAAAQDLST